MSSSIWPCLPFLCIFLLIALTRREGMRVRDLLISLGLVLISAPLATLPSLASPRSRSAEALSGNAWLAVGLAVFFHAAQHCALPLVFDALHRVAVGRIFTLRRAVGHHPALATLVISLYDGRARSAGFAGERDDADGMTLGPY